MANKGICSEPDVLRKLNQKPPTPHCLPLLSLFELPRKSTAEGDHLCFVTPIYHGDFGAFSYPYVREDEYLPLPVIERVLLHTLRGLAHLHANGIVHTDIKRNNIFIGTGLTNAEIEDFLVKNPARRHVPEMSDEGIVQSAVTQTFPPISMEEAAKATYLLADYGTAVPSKLHLSHVITVPAFRPPEVFLSAEWDKPADIWAFGCQIFEVLTGRSLFSYESKAHLSDVAYMLWQMATVIGDRYDPEYLKKCSNVEEIFEPDGSFKDGLEISDS